MSHQRRRMPPSTVSAPSPVRTTLGGLVAMLPASVRVALSAVGILSVTLVALAWSGARPAPVPEPQPAPPVPGVASLIDGRFPVTVNDRVEYWIHQFLGAGRSSFEGYLVREGLYGGMIREELKVRGMPEELLYLAMIESGFSATAISKVQATGVWQFLDETAQAYGLTVDYWVDERRDPIRATEAAFPATPRPTRRRACARRATTTIVRASRRR